MQPQARSHASTSGSGTSPAQAREAGRNGAPAVRARSVANVGGGSAAGAASASALTSSVNEGGRVVQRKSLNAILVNTCQKGNPVVTNIRNTPWEYGDIKADYQVGATTGVLYLSYVCHLIGGVSCRRRSWPTSHGFLLEDLPEFQLRYHLLHPEYIHQRIKGLAQSYSLRLVLMLCDVDNHQAATKELTKICIVNNLTVIVAWSTQECSRYLELYKQFERKAPDLIKERVDDSYMSHLTSALTSVKGVNKTDVTTLASNCLTFRNIVTASPDALGALPGLGDKKVRRLRDAFEGSFVVTKKKRVDLMEKKSIADRMAEKGHALN
ncbi:BZ3500_MvSof-1268-A1-R1_Chr9g10557 [Microbotryum saponariae]|uniref:BZ3500_MvSof-1268-A1-R1_Chr9g10557 protein n=1 Tax=Microbotryum saponariae TaxID=289078 RepID=A0A2X0LMN3_9BASI|nr:BZ3501_MvSof-1269-A2-R1_Chr9g10306 [Microbotryum saponariae]SDA00293.1 BZ3500_MvSof-1268-A1-R1_Chr9g10557 [Microbotryum saponariae]